MRSLVAIALLMLGGCAALPLFQPSPLQGEWTVSAIGGRATPAIGSYRMTIDRNHLGGQFGCNHFGGDYRFVGGMVTTGAIAMTEMACSEPASSFEATGMAIFAQPMRVDWANDRRVTLSNGAGVLTLDRR